MVCGIRGPPKALLLIFVGISLLVSSFLIPLHSFLPAWAHYYDSYIISPGGRSSLRIGLMSGSTARVMVASNGSEDHITFSIEDYDGKTIISERIASTENSFEFKPARTDFHVLVFENDGPVAQSVYWTVWVYYYDTLFQLLGVPLPILGVVMITLSHRKEKQVFGESIITGKSRKRLRGKGSNLGMDVTLVKGIGQKRSEQMKAVGVDSVYELVECSPRDLAEKVGVSEKTANAWIENANEVLSLIKEATVSER